MKKKKKERTKKIRPNFLTRIAPHSRNKTIRLFTLDFYDRDSSRDSWLGLHPRQLSRDRNLEFLIQLLPRSFLDILGVKNNFYQKRDYDMEDAFYWWIYTRPYLVWS